METKIVLLMLVCFIVKHFICDFPLQTSYMLQKSKLGWGWILPLLSHSAVHAIASLIILVLFGKGQYAWLALIELAIHFIIDRVKGHPHLLGRFKPTESSFWTSLGFDQMLHYITYILMVYIQLN